MFDQFTWTHIPALFVATATTFGGLLPFFSAKRAIEGFGLPKRFAVSKEAQPIMVFCSARITTIGAIMFAFYFQDKFAEVDTVMLVLGAYVGGVDGYVCWREGARKKGVERALSGAAIAAWGWFGMTAGA
ncbi:hypothetical protein BDV95DRAFT_486310 [Massariosphaeria phaeospora]|uniref:Uncharacterized protein n=1 Tax=Massariosphaeria phaeospora TaxID=100035 RepID=A0A7C8IAT4_9PLEO|nr:hypothetical protein BDV95DRAFT_486310 [Massariosphaeria phaeospora]